MQLSEIANYVAVLSTKEEKQEIYPIISLDTIHREIRFHAPLHIFSPSGGRHEREGALVGGI